MSEEKSNEIDEEGEKVELKRVKEEREKIKKMGLEEKSKKSFSVLSNVNTEKEREHHKKRREKKFVGFGD
ncbi:MAG: hypothetical protein HWN67_19045 [Candidatus Helarchaeota archaeon]|nr:hypothetical protein [Candidatus Helarchaeota archaeon]